MAQVFSASGFDQTVIGNALPNQQVMANGVLMQLAYNQHPAAEEWIEQFSVSKKLERMTFTLGGFFGHSDVSQISGGGGLGFAPIGNRPQLLDITLTTPEGVVQQVTDPAGFGAVGNTLLIGGREKAVQKQASAFFGHNWRFTDAWSLDWGVRYEHIDVSGTNINAVPLLLAGGLDGDPNTLYDNDPGVFTDRVKYDDSLDFFSYSGALSYVIDDRNSVYARYSQGKKAPDLTFYFGRTTQFQVDNVPAVPEGAAGRIRLSISGSRTVVLRESVLQQAE